MFLRGLLQFLREFGDLLFRRSLFDEGEEIVAIGSGRQLTAGESHGNVQIVCALQLVNGRPNAGNGGRWFRDRRTWPVSEDQDRRNCADTEQGRETIAMARAGGRSRG